MLRKACWHKSCYILFNTTKLKRDEKRQEKQNPTEVGGGKFTRSNATKPIQRDDRCASFLRENHTNYARWLPVHLRDMCVLQKTAPDVAAAFQEGLFAVNKTARKF